MLPLPSGWTNAFARAVNDSGQVAGSLHSATQDQAFIGTAAGINLIPLLPAWTYSYGFGGLNASGQVLGYGGNASSQQAFLYTASASTAIPLPPGASTSVINGFSNINDSGAVVGSSNAGAWLWTSSQGAVLLNTVVPSGWAILDAYGISNNGLILAVASYSGGANQWVQLSPYPCFVSINPGSVNVSASANSGSFTVATGTGCNWTAASNNSFVSITSGASGSGNGTVNFSVPANTGALPLVGTITVASPANNQTFTVNQATVPPTAPTLASPINGAVQVSLAPMLSWSAAAGATSYDVYFGTYFMPPFAVNTTSTNYNPGTLVSNNIYHWQVVARNSGGTNASPVWAFTTQRLAGGPVVPVLDFNGDGKQDVFLYDPVAGGAYAGLSNGTGGFSYVFNFFTPGFDTIRYGDFNGDGKSDLIAYNSTTALGYVLLGSGSGTFSSAVSMYWGPGFTKVAAGDLNGDGLTDFVLYRPTDGTCYTAISNGDGTFRYQYTLVSGGFTHMLVADFSGDGKADVFFYRSADARAYLGIGNGTGGFTFSPVNLQVGMTFIESGDINGDGKADLVLYQNYSGGAWVGLSMGTGFTAFTGNLLSLGFTSMKVLDFNGDGFADVAFYNANNTLGYLGLSDGAGNFTFSSLFWGAGITTVNPLDLNGDGKIDVVIYNTSNAAAYTGISSGNPASPFTYQYSFWGTGKVLATAAAQP